MADDPKHNLTLQSFFLPPVGDCGSSENFLPSQGGKTAEWTQEAKGHLPFPPPNPDNPGGHGPVGCPT